MPATFLNALSRLVGGDAHQHDVTATGVDTGIDRPNIIVVVTDDMRDSDWQALPKIRQRVGGNGTTFPNFFLTTPACAPSRASTLVNYVGLDEAIIDYVCEIAGSLKIGKCMPGTLIPVVDEARLFEDQPDAAVIFSWHIAEELAPKLRAKGFRGQLITPLPVPRAL